MTLSINQHHNSAASSSPTSLSPPTSPSTLTSHFVQALHDYLPSTVNNTDESVCCLFFKKGSIIEVFNRDDSGWWDGQCGDVRGWFPSNYVGRIGDLKRSSADFEDDYSNDELDLWHQRMNQHVNITSTMSLEEYSTKVSTTQHRVEMARALFREDRRHSNSSKSSQLHLLLQDVSKRVAELVDACSQPASSNVQLIVCQVVAAVKSVLTEANIVNKESALLKMYPELARQRKLVLSALSRLVLKGKELQQGPQQQPAKEQQTEDDQTSYFADQLLNEIEMFEKLLMVIPRQSSISESTVDTTRPSSMFHCDTPRSSVSSFGRSSVISTASNTPSLRQSYSHSFLNQSSASLIAKAVPLPDKEHILHNILDHQASIDELMASLVITLERYLVNRQSATELLETTRKSVEAVRTFLAVIEHVCSNLGDLDYSGCVSTIPEDPCLVSLVITKESVYSAITNLVTAVRALSGPSKQCLEDDSILKDDINHLRSCCEDVVKTANECAACVRTCLQAEQEEHDKNMYTVQENIKPDTASAATELPVTASVAAADKSSSLSMLGRKISSLHAIQHYKEDQNQEAELCEKLGDEGHSEQDIEGLAIETAPKISTNTENSAPKSLRNGQDVRAQPLSFNKNSSLPPLLSTSSSASSSSTNATTNNMLDLASAVDTIIPETIPQRRSRLRPRAASVNNSQFLPLPPLPPKNNIIIKPSVSTLPPTVNTTITSTALPPQQDVPIKGAPKDHILKSRRSRGLSVSSLRPSMSKSKSDRITNTTTTLSTSSSLESLPEALKIKRLPSWMSLSSSTTEKNEQTSVTSIDSTPSSPLHITKYEPEYSFLKQYTFTEDEMIFNADREVTGATIEALVQKLTLHEKSPDLIFTRAFFYNFRLFTKPADFVRLLKDRFALKPPTEPAPLPDDQLALWTNRVLIPVRLRVYNVIKTWLETYFSFEQDASVEQSLLNFASNEMSKAMPGPAKRMLELITRTFGSKGLTCASRKHAYNETRLNMQKSLSTALQQSTLGSSTGNIFSNLTLFDDHHQLDSSLTEKYPPSIMSKSFRNTLKKALSLNSLIGIHVNDFDPTELARQLTIMENSLFCCIRPNEMIGQEFKKKLGTSQAIHIKAMIQKSTQITSWVSDTILNETDTKKRAQMLKYWIKVGDACLQLNNYNTLMAIRSALDSTSIIRLRKTWEYMSPKYKTMWEPIYRATDSQRNFAEYRHRLKTTIAPCLPFLGVYLTDMTFIDDGNADRRMSPGGKSLINFDKYIKVTRILNEIDQFQISYKLIEVEEIQRFLKTTLETVEQDDQVFYTKSLILEPKEEDPADKQ
ncbi:ras guanine nucleotide exchange factor domain-containing protein [Parasitella parasitica]|nr:ras guanine nucleotide exchange factor domain-containing protein [Parasitella parasitica]